MTIREVETVTDAETVRKIRNECREWMTRDSEEIARNQQRQWWATKPANWRLFLLEVNKQPAGFGLVREEKYDWVTAGLRKEFRGRGLGRILFSFLSGWSRPALEVLETNVPAYRLYRSLGYVEVERNNGIIIMRLIR